MDVRLHMLEIGDDGESHNDQQRPGTPFAYVDRRPSAKLIGILPQPEECADVLGKPDKKAN